MTAQDYPVTFGYRAMDGVYYGPRGSIGAYHKGNDRRCPVGTPIVISGVTIGKTGNSGATSGAHLHTQAGSDIGCQNDTDPSAFEFQLGTVVRIRTTDTAQWGRYITVRTHSGVYITYAHLNEVLVKVGDVIKEEEPMVNDGDIVNMYRVELGREPDASGKAAYINKPWKEVWYSITGSDEFRKKREKASADTQKLQDAVSALERENTTLSNALTEEKAYVAKYREAYEKAEQKLQDIHNQDTTNENALKSFIRAVFNWFKKG